MGRDAELAGPSRRLHARARALALLTEFTVAFDEVEGHVDAHRSQLILLQCAADSLRSERITHLAYTEAPMRTPLRSRFGLKIHRLASPDRPQPVAAELHRDIHHHE